MAHSDFAWTDRVRPYTAIGHDAAGQPLPNYLYIEQAPAGRYTSAADLATFVAAGLPGPNGEPVRHGVLKPATIALMYTPQPNTEGDTYGLGYQTTVYGAGIVGHSGSNCGWRGFFGAAPETRQGVVLLTNGDKGRELYKALLAELKAPGAH